VRGPTVGRRLGCHVLFFGILVYFLGNIRFICKCSERCEYATKTRGYGLLLCVQDDESVWAASDDVLLPASGYILEKGPGGVYRLWMETA
jgi:hypothetical protein